MLESRYLILSRRLRLLELGVFKIFKQFLRSFLERCLTKRSTSLCLSCRVVTAWLLLRAGSCAKAEVEEPMQHVIIVHYPWLVFVRGFSACIKPVDPTCWG